MCPRHGGRLSANTARCLCVQSWQAEHCLLSLVGIVLDSVNGKGPMVSSLLGGVSFSRLLLKLIECSDPQVWTVPNAITGVRIAGVAAAGMIAIRSKARDGWLLSDATLAAMGSTFVALDLLDGYADWAEALGKLFSLLTSIP